MDAPDTHWEGRRILVIWTDAAANEGSDWISFVVEHVCDKGLVLRGVDSPDGIKHDGSKVFIWHSEIRDIIEWK